MDQVSWAALTIGLTVLGGIWTVLTFRRRGFVWALRPLAITLLPLAAYLTRTLRLVTAIATDVSDWALGLVLSPTVWFGVGLAGASVVLLLLSARLRAHVAPPPRRGRLGRSRPAVETGGTTTTAPPPTPARRQAKKQSSGDPELDEIEELLRRRGIQ